MCEHNVTIVCHDRIVVKINENNFVILFKLCFNLSSQMYAHEAKEEIP